MINPATYGNNFTKHLQEQKLQLSAVYG